MPKRKLKFEDHIEQIDAEIKKRKSKWNLTALSWMDFDDVSQILRIHIFKKWHLYDPQKPLNPWINPQQLWKLLSTLFEMRRC